MTGLRDLFGSERGVFCIFVAIAAFALVLLGKITGDAWLDLMKWVAGGLLVSKAATNMMATHVTKQAQFPAARVVSGSGRDTAPDPATPDVS